ncbi:MAG TPA: hypothetical protein DCQ06_13180 [Myxococcales bacterium]|nr:hypothetical protein [Myxococcales bacterium]HAN32542.1 hypothetical protein [Myxococcales bacterium]
MDTERLGFRDRLLEKFDLVVLLFTAMGIGVSLVSMVLLWRVGAQIPVLYLVIGLVSVNLATSILLYLLVAVARQRLGVRLAAMRDAAHELGGGDLSVEMPEGDDDLGAMGASLNTMRERVGRLLKAQRDLLSGVSHELRSPLARIEVGLELIDMELAGQGEHELIVGIREEVALLERHIARLLEAQRVTRDRVVLRKESVVVNDLIKTVVGRERFRLNKLNWKVELDLLAEYARVQGDINALDRVFSTLIENAIRHASMPANDIDPTANERSVASEEPWQPTLRVESSIRDRSLVIRFMDRGPGLDEAQCVQVFEPFFRGDRSRNTATGGTGLGMYLTRNIMRAHRGDVLAHPRTGGGLVVEMRLPLQGQGESKETMRVRWTDAREEVAEL